MRAAVYHGPGDVRIESVPDPERMAGEALIRVLRSGLCGTDATEWKAGPLTFPVDRVHPVTGHSGPMVMGHEFIGEIVETDPASGFAVGDIVASGAGVSCGRCPRCLEGRTNLCAEYYTLGLNANGGMAQLVSCPVGSLARVPEGLSIDHAGLAQPLAVGLHAARRAGVRDGDRVVIIGAGAIGTFVLAGLSWLAEAAITVVDFDGPRLHRALRLGASRILAADGLSDSALAEELGGSPADVVIEASGAPGQLARAIALVRPGGRVLQVGLPSADQPVNVHSLVMREITIETTLAHVCGEDLEPALKILAETHLGGELLDSVHSLDELPGLLDRLAHGQVEGKVLFDPTIVRTTMTTITTEDGNTP